MNITNSILAVIAICSVLMTAFVLINLPDVYMTQDYKCVKVVSVKPNNCSCDNLPEKYNTVFVANR